jgi:hypothetical protein
MSLRSQKMRSALEAAAGLAYGLETVPPSIRERDLRNQHCPEAARVEV